MTTARFLRSQTRDACLAYPSITLRILNKEVTVSLTHGGSAAVVDTVGVGDDESTSDQPLISLAELVAL